MSLMDILRTAFFALRGNWMRSALTSLGVIIGIAAVIVMVSIGQGTQAEIDKMVSGPGFPARWTSAGPVALGRAVRARPKAAATASPVAMWMRSATKCPRCSTPRVRCAAAPRWYWRKTMRRRNGRACRPTGLRSMAGRSRRGICSRPNDYGGSTKPVILGETVRKALFGDNDGIGQTIRLGRVPFTVVGVLASKGQGGFGQDQDDIVVVPLEAARRRLSNSQSMPPGGVQQIAVGVDDPRNLASAQSEIEGLLRQRHKIDPGAEDDFSVRNISQIVATRTATTNLMSKLLGAVAGICLIIGGIGIMNIMLVSVTERIREIGLRMAVGAGPSDVRRQFLAEAMLISLIGGVIGIAIGVAGALIVGKLGDLPVELNAQVVMLAAAFSIGTGLFFGYYPARKASLLDPIEALRQQ